MVADQQRRAARRLRPQRHRAHRLAAAHRARQAVPAPGLQVLVVGRPADVDERSEVRGHQHAARRRARSRPRRNVRAAGGRRHHDQRRRRQLGRVARRADRVAQGAGHADVHGGRRQGTADPRRAGDAGGSAAPRAEGHGARRRRRRDADRLFRREGAAHRRRRRPHGEHAGDHAARPTANRRR